MRRFGRKEKEVDSSGGGDRAGGSSSSDRRGQQGRGDQRRMPEHGNSGDRRNREESTAMEQLLQNLGLDSNAGPSTSTRRQRLWLRPVDEHGDRVKQVKQDIVRQARRIGEGLDSIKQRGGDYLRFRERAREQINLVPSQLQEDLHQPEALEPLYLVANTLQIISNEINSFLSERGLNEQQSSDIAPSPSEGSRPVDQSLQETRRRNGLFTRDVTRARPGDRRTNQPRSNTDAGASESADMEHYLRDQGFSPLQALGRRMVRHGENARRVYQRDRLIREYAREIGQHLEVIRQQGKGWFSGYRDQCRNQTRDWINNAHQALNSSEDREQVLQSLGNSAQGLDQMRKQLATFLEEKGLSNQQSPGINQVLQEMAPDYNELVIRPEVMQDQQASEIQLSVREAQQRNEGFVNQAELRSQWRTARMRREIQQRRRAPASEQPGQEDLGQGLVAPGVREELQRRPTLTAMIRSITTRQSRNQQQPDQPLPEPPPLGRTDQTGRSYQPELRRGLSTRYNKPPEPPPGPSNL